MEMQHAPFTPHAAVKLWAEHAPEAGYPPKVLPVPKPIRGTSFFPGGFGLWNPESSEVLPAFPYGGTMILGHDFHSETGYKASLQRGHESLTQPTWRNLLILLDTAGITLESCFFTNVFMGLREGRATTGRFPGASDLAFVAHCMRFLFRQIDLQRPSLIVTLGIHAPKMLAPLSPGLAQWSTGTGIKHLDNAGPLLSRIEVTGIADYRTTAVALIHPSLRHASVRHRRYRDLGGNEAELAMLREAKERALQTTPG
jgi:hypothetical protein